MARKQVLSFTISRIVTIAVYDKSNNTLQGTTLTTSGTYACRNWINADPDNRDVAIILPALYFGDNNDRRTAEGYQDGSSLISAIVPDILSDRPIPSNADYIISAIQDGNDDWRTDRVFCPFNQLLRNNWGVSTTTSQSNQMMMGVFQQYTYAQLRAGAQSYINLSDKITGQFFRFNSAVKTFDDVVYKWDLKYYDITTKQFIDNGTDITNRSGNFKILTVLNLIDKKGQSKGIASERAVKHELAYLGFYFAETEEKAKTDNLLNGDGVYLPEIVGGVTTGNYFTGEDIASVPYAGAESVAPFQFVPSETDDTGDWSYNINSGTIGAGVKYYALTETNMNNLCYWLNTTYNPTDETEFIQDFKGQNPGDYLVSVMYYPFDIPVDTGTDETIVVGKLTATGSTGRVLKYKYGELYNYGSYTIPAQGNFIDYMRKISVIVPFCGTKDLDPLIWTGQTLTVKMAIDFPTGACTAFLFRGTQVMDTLSGSLGVPLPLSALSNGNYQVAITNMLAQKNQATIGGITRTASGIANITGGILDMKNAGSVSAGGVANIIGGTVSAAGGAIQTAVGLPNLEYNIEHTQPEIKQIDGGSPFINCGVDFRVKILICTPILSQGYDPASYGKTTGYSCCKQGKLSSVSSGFTVCAGAQLDGIQATATEKSMIYNALQGGVFV